ncbi:DUF6941 family protein [Mycobacterium sp.]|uniref:DUF6941 family protein n=1 Tax=Mycobacterium sp. TaxID=1785 RepID=UPI003F9E4FEB
MKITLLLARFAESDPQGTISALGLGWKTCPTPLPPIAVVVFLDIDWNETNQPHKLMCDLVTADGQPVAIPGPLGPQPVHFEAQIEAGRPPGAIHGTPMRAPLAINIAGGTSLPPGRYEWRVGVEGLPDQTAVEAFLVVQQPQLMQPGPPQAPTPPQADQ